MLTVDFDLLNVHSGDIVLDAGCGEGRHSFEFVIRGASVFCMDMDIESLRKARIVLNSMKEHNQFHENATYHVHSGDTLKLPFHDETFDKIICAEVMEHVDDDDLACRELTRVLKKGGKIAITIPTFISESIYDMLTYEYFTSPGGHIRKYRPKELSEIMKRNGLIVYAIDFKHSFHTIYWMIRCIVGLHLNDHPITKWYRKFLTMGLSSEFMKNVEGFFDYFFPKSLVLYAYKK